MFTLNDLERVMHQPEKIRNLSVIAHVDHGKSTLTDSLFAGAGLIRMEQAGTRRVTDNRDDEAARCITIKSTGVSLLFPESNLLPETLINLIDSPGHVDFSSEVTAALRATDGALVVVDCVEGVCVQTETVLRQALQERIKPVLVINKLDRMFLELQCTPEEMYQRLCRVIESVNVILSTYQDETMEEMLVDPMKGTVAFTAGLMGWGFTLPQFARFYANKLQLDPKKLQRNLWGDRFISKEHSGKWTSKLPNDLHSPNCHWSRGFCEYVLKPIQTIFESAATDQTNWIALEKVLNVIDVQLTQDERELSKKSLIKCVLQHWIPAHLPLLELAVHHLPSPLQAQKYRIENLYTGPMEDEIAQAMKTCDAEGPLLIYISKLAPERPNDPSSRFFAFGRVFSGTVRPGQQIRILGPNYQPGKRTDLFENISVSRICCMIPKPQSVQQIPAGNTVAVMGIDKYLSKNGTLTNDPLAYPMRSMSYSVSAVVKQAVEPCKTRDLPKLVQAMKQLSNSDNLVQCTIDEKTGEYIIAGAGELHLEICFNDLQSFMGEAKIQIKDPIVSYCETVLTESKICLAKSPNNHNRLFGRASPVSKNLLQDILEGDFDTSSSKSVKNLQHQYGWDPNQVKNLWSFSPNNGNRTNLLVNSTHGVQYMNEIKDNVVAALEWVANEGVLTKEPLQGIRYDLTDCVLHADAIHRTGNQIIPAARRLFYAAQLSASPRLLEPIYRVEITCPRHALKGCYNVLMKRRGTILEEIPRERSNLLMLKAYLPVADSFGFDGALRAETGGEAFPTMIFDHWQIIDSDPLEEGSEANKIAKQIRERKGLSTAIPTLDQYLDRL